MAQPKKSKKELEKERERRKMITIFSIGGGVLAVIIIVLVIVLISQNCNGSKESSTASLTSSTTSVTSTVSGTSSAESSTSQSSIDLTSVPGSEINYPIDPAKNYFTDIKIKDYGTITVQLNPDAAPITVKNFLKLADSGFYNGLTLHRIMNGFMMQGGDPNGNGTGGSDTKIFGEFAQNGFNNPLSHTKGAISMARTSYDMNSASSQFFIVQGDSVTNSLDGMYACFGYVTQGLELVDKICADAKPTDNNGTIPPEQQPVIESITVRTTDK